MIELPSLVFNLRRSSRSRSLLFGFLVDGLDGRENGKGTVRRKAGLFLFFRWTIHRHRLPLNGYAVLFAFGLHLLTIDEQAFRSRTQTK
jgi:hypothetical protein